MKKIFNILSIAIIALAAVSCDTVSEDERFGEVTEINKDHKVLVEEFTGQYCINCPLGHEALKGIKKMYGDNAVIVSIHAGGETNAYYDPVYGLGTPDGDKYAAMWGIQGYPSAVVNRTSGVLTDRALWQGSVFKSAITPPKVKISLEASINDNKTIKIHSTLATTGDDIKGKYQIWITEDNFIGFQANNNEYIPDYVHNNVYRASANGIGGEEIQLNANAKTIEHSIEIASNWNADNLKVVAFVYDDSGVLQAEETKANK